MEPQNLVSAGCGLEARKSCPALGARKAQLWPRLHPRAAPKPPWAPAGGLGEGVKLLHGGGGRCGPEESPTQ